MIVMQRDRNSCIRRACLKCNTRTVCLNVLAQCLQSVLLRIYFVAVLSAHSLCIRIHVHVQSLWNRIIPRCFRIIQSNFALCKALCPDHPPHLANGFIQIKLWQQLLELLVGAVKMEIVLFQCNGCVCIQGIAIFVTNAYPPACTSSGIGIGVGINTVILLRLRRIESGLLVRLCADKHVGIDLQMLFQNVMHLLRICSVLCFQFIR